MSIRIAIPILVTMLRLVRPVGGRTCVQLRERMQILVPFVLVLAVVALATLGYLELVAILQESVTQRTTAD
ncbi:hypothetical protein D8Y22_03205 [Salinadaptatus halalkaliphilus]|uniref:Uncharacterized protein n=1 Tax=Salinadaptatus halalkaliphilus TaxID=2419781 RepID=A0A4S3TPL0_9EURY|nr:hypothetical protein [Salinadaptatus halalkaliphilus]THE66294.1 hypothetical protein D8Y22_03205 [Salinadaptatus halalkaliphilus]